MCYCITNTPTYSAPACTHMHCYVFPLALYCNTLFPTALAVRAHSRLYARTCIDLWLIRIVNALIFTQRWLLLYKHTHARSHPHAHTHELRMRYTWSIHLCAWVCVRVCKCASGFIAAQNAHLSAHASARSFHRDRCAWCHQQAT